MERQSFIFFTSWLSGLEGFSQEEQAEIAFALLRYCAFGQEPDMSKPYVRLAFTYAKPQIDANYARYLNGKKGGRPSKEKNLNETETEPNVYVNDNVNVNDKEKEIAVKEKDDNDDEVNILEVKNRGKAKQRFEERTKTLVQDDSNIGQFNRWLIKNAPYIVGHYDHLVTENELKNLMSRYTIVLIFDTILKLENDIRRRSNYENLYILLSKNWLPIALEKWQRQQLAEKRSISQMDRAGPR